jgi:hypothetical protein
MAHRTATRVLYYVCANGNVCVCRRMDYVDSHVAEAVIEWLSRPDALQWLIPDGAQLGKARQRAQEAKEMLDIP